MLLPVLAFCQFQHSVDDVKTYNTGEATVLEGFKVTPNNNNLGANIMAARWLKYLKEKDAANAKKESVASNDFIPDLDANDLLLLKCAKEKDYLISNFLMNKGFKQIPVYKDSEGYDIYTWSYNNGTSWIEMAKTIKRDSVGHYTTYSHLTFYSIYPEYIHSLDYRIREMFNLTSADILAPVKDPEGWLIYIYIPWDASHVVRYEENDHYRGTKVYRLVFMI